MSDRTCPSCGAHLAPDDTKCVYCGWVFWVPHENDTQYIEVTTIDDTKARFTKG